MVKKVAIIKLKSDHDIEWRINKVVAGLTHLFGKKFESLRKIDGKSFMPQLTPYYLAALGREYDGKSGNNYLFRVIDEYPWDVKASGEFDMVWFTTMTTTANAVYRKADEFRSRGVKVVLGGIHPSMMPKEAILHADSVAIGEGEVTIPEILKDFSKGKLKQFYHGGIVDSLVGLPIPAWELSDGSYAKWVLPVQTSRGCGNACHYCSTTKFQGAKRRHRPIEDVVGELEYYIRKGLLTDKNAVFLTDNNSVADTNYRKGVFDTSYSKSLFSAIADLRNRSGVKFYWVGQGEINMADDDELLELASRSGCITQLIGYESLSQDNLDGHAKIGNRVERYPEQTDKIHSYGIQIIGCFVFGMPNDKPDVFVRTHDFIKKYIDIPQISLLTPYPGTALFVKAKSKGLILSEDWDKYDITHVTMQPECRDKDGVVIGAGELDRRYSGLVNKLYGWGEIFGRSWRAANRFVDHDYNFRSRKSKFLSVFAPNLIYRELSLIGRK